MRKFIAKVLGITGKHIEIPEERLKMYTIGRTDTMPTKIQSKHTIDLALVERLGESNAKFILADIERQAGQRIYEELKKNRPT